jgi:hypothetical protein
MVHSNRNLLTLVVLLLMFGSVAHAQTKRVAIVIGNAEYKNERPLRNPVNDAALIARTLRENLGFTKVIERANLHRRALVDVVDQIVSEGAGADAIVVYYSGHGMQGGDGSYLLPVDAVMMTSVPRNRAFQWRLTSSFAALAAAYFPHSSPSLPTSRSSCSSIARLSHPCTRSRVNA